MPRFYFDLCDADGLHPDADGLEFDTQDAARVEARRTLPAMATGLMTDDTARTLVMIVRDEGGAPIYTATLTLCGMPLAKAD